MIKAVVIDDEPLARMVVLEYLQAFPQVSVVAECGDGFEGLKAIQQHLPALVFLDIQMPKITGFEMLELLDEPPSIIFTTAFDEYAIKAFEASAVDYLLKPFSQERFNKAMQKWLQLQAAQQTHGYQQLEEHIPQQQERIVVKIGNNIRIIPVHDIIYLEAADDYVKIHTAEGHFLKNKTMAFFRKTTRCQPVCTGAPVVSVGRSAHQPHRPLRTGKFSGHSPQRAASAREQIGLHPPAGSAGDVSNLASSLLRCIFEQ